MRQRKSYEKDRYTIVLESLSTTEDEEDEPPAKERETPFDRDESHVSILSEIEKRLTKFPRRLLLPGGEDQRALVLYRSPESMGLPSKGNDVESAKEAIRMRIRERNTNGDGYEADGEEMAREMRRNTRYGNGVPRLEEMEDEVLVDEEEEEGDMMDLD
jgi:hypothetical protein